MQHVSLLGSLLCLSACAGAGAFPLREPLTRDDDERPFHPAPEEYESSFIWDGADQLVFRPISDMFAVDPAGRALNVNAFDEVPDSSWFENRLGAREWSAADIAKGSCDERELSTDMPDGSWIIDQGKPNGANPGFRIDVPGYGKFMLKADTQGEPDRATGATAIASRLYHAAGYFAPCDSVVYFEPKLLSLKPGLYATDNSGVARPFDEAALAKLLGSASHRGKLVRMGASQWLPGKPIGPYRYEGTRDDDPNDVIDHEDRRELRGGRLLAAWLNHFDSREQNTMDVFIATEPGRDDSPGFVRHYILDLGDCFGSTWSWEGISRRLGHAYYFDLPYVAADFVSLGTIERPWERAQTNGIFNYFSARDFDPEAWVPGYPNPAFGRMTEADGAWMARILAAFKPEHVKAAVAVGKYDDRSAHYLETTLLARRRAILTRYLSRLSPLSKLRTEGDRLCGIDLARATGIVPDEGAHYTARLIQGGERRALSKLWTERGGRFCVELPRGLRGENYLIVEVWNGHAEGALRAHLYDLGTQGLRLVGIERT